MKIYFCCVEISNQIFFCFSQFLFALVTASHGGSYQFMAFMSKPKHSESGQLLDAGTDLNMAGGLAE